ncbi:tape measure protein [Niabella insulamsoli]|uniref:tape measure protein n=1 Tax=Niabella insulamsoli TaxID=3144874 RepID=UPI0031FCFF83
MSKGVQYVLEVLDYATAPFERLFGNLGKASTAFDDLSDRADTEMKQVGGSVEQVASSIGSTFDAATQGAANSFESAANNIIADANRIESNVSSPTVKTITVKGNDNATGILNRIKTGVAGIKSKVIGIGARDTATNIISRIKNGLSSLKDKVVTIKTQTMGSPLGGMLSSFSPRGVIDMIGGPLVAGGLGLGVLLGGAINKGMESDLQKTNITTLLRGDVEKAGRLFSELSTYSIKTPYEKADIIDGQKTMMSFGLSTEFAFGKLKNIGDIAMGDAQKMKSLTLAFSQATSAGKLQGQDLLQMINAGFNPLQVISERTGESMARLKKRMEEGGISAGELATAFEWATDQQGLFYQGAEKASSTFAGKVSNLKDAFSEGLISIYDQLKPVLMPLLDQLITGIGVMTDVVVGGLSKVGDALKWVWDKFQEGNPIVLSITAIVAGFAIQMAISKTVTLAITAATNLWTGAQWLLNAAMTANPIGLVIAGIVALAAWIAYIIYKYEGWGAAWENLIAWLDNNWQLFKQSFITVWLQTENFFLSGIDRLKVAWLSFKSLWDQDAANAGMQKMAEDQKVRMKAIAESQAKEKDFDKKATEALAGVKLVDTGKTFKDALSSISQKVGIPTGAGAAASEISKQNSKTNASQELGMARQAAGAGAGKARGINEGGNRPTSYTITIHKLQDTLVVNTNGGPRDAGKRAGTDVVNEILMALNSVDQKGGGGHD